MDIFLNNSHKHFQNKVFILFSVVSFLLIVTPANILVGPLNIVFLFIYCILGIIFFITLEHSKVSYKEMDILFPILIFILIITVSHINGVTYSIPLSINDFSEYPKFLLPYIVFFSTLLALKRKDTIVFLYASIIMAAIVYSLLFLIYFVDDGNFIYSIGLGRGDIRFYRYGGLDQNPNAYASIAFILFLILLPLLMKPKYKIIYFILPLLFLSFIAAQSRTNIIASGFIISLLLLLAPLKLKAKAIILFAILGLLIFALMNLELYWLLFDNRFDVANDRSFGIRVTNSLENYKEYKNAIGIIGIGPGKNALRRLDTITYIMYYIRYGVLGIIVFLIIHIWISFYFFYYLFISRLKCHFKSDKYIQMNMLINTFIPIYTLILNISNEKWIDVKYLFIWFIFIAIGIQHIETVKKINKESIIH